MKMIPTVCIYLFIECLRTIGTDFVNVESIVVNFLRKGRDCIRRRKIRKEKVLVTRKKTKIFRIGFESNFSTF